MYVIHNQNGHYFCGSVSEAEPSIWRPRPEHAYRFGSHTEALDMVYQIAVYESVHKSHTKEIHVVGVGKHEGLEYRTISLPDVRAIDRMTFMLRSDRLKLNVDYAITCRGMGTKEEYHLLCCAVFLDNILETAGSCGITFATTAVY